MEVMGLEPFFVRFLMTFSTSIRAYILIKLENSSEVESVGNQVSLNRLFFRTTKAKIKQ